MISLAWAALFLWPLVTIVLFQKLSLPFAVCITIVGGYLLLPQGLSIDLPVLPPINRATVPAFMALLMTAVVLGQRTDSGPELKGYWPRSPITAGLIVMLLVGVFGTALTNSDPLFFGPRYIPGMRLYDAFSFSLELIVLLIPLLLGRKILGSVEGQRALILTIGVSGVIYAFPALFEVRMSPQIHFKIYGFYPGSFLQQVRGDGFRPTVFLNHGLSLSIFFAIALLGIAGLYRSATGVFRVRWGLALLLLLITIVLSKSLGALVIALMLLPAALFFKSRTQVALGAAVAATVLLFPMLRSIDVVPVDRAVVLAESVSPERAHSLRFRLRNEEVLLSKARERIVFGWGGWGRNRVYAKDGRDISVTDGSWIIQMGIGGWVRYLGVFGLICWSIIGLFLSKGSKVDRTSAALALMICAKTIDLIPNSDMFPVLWLMAGSLLGRLEADVAITKPVGTKVLDVDSDRKLKYARVAVGESHTRSSRYAKAENVNDALPDKQGGSSYTRFKTAHSRTRSLTDEE